MNAWQRTPRLLLFVAVCCGNMAVAGTAQDDQSSATQVQQRLDLYGDPLPPGALVRMGTLQFRHGTTMSNAPLIFSSDGKRLISASDGDQTVRIWDVATGKQLRAQKFPPSSSFYWPALALTPDGHVAIAGSEGVFMWDGKDVHGWKKIAPAAPGWRSLSMSSVGRRLAICSQDTIGRIWDLATEMELPVSLSHRGGIHEIHLSHSGKMGATVGAESVSVWDVSSGRELHRFPTRSHSRGLRTAAISPNEKYVAVKEGSGIIAVWLLASGKRIGEFPPNRYSDATFSPDSRYLAAAGGDSIRVWDIVAGKEYRKLPRSGSFLAFSPDGRTLAYRRGSTICLWDLAADQQFTHRPAHQINVGIVTFSPNGKLLASAAHNTVIVWDAANGKPVHHLQGHENTIDCLAFTIDGKSLVSACARDHTIRRWDVAGGKEIGCLTFAGVAARKFEGPSFRGDVRLSSDGQTMLLLRQGANSPEDRAIRAWDVDSGKELYFRESSNDVLLPELLSRDGQQMHATLLKTILFRNDRGFSLGVLPPAISPDGKIVAIPDWKNEPSPSAASSDVNGFTLWETATGQQLIRIPTGPARAAAFSPNGRTLLSVGPDSLQLWDIATGKRLFRQPAHETFVGNNGNIFASSWAFAPDGRSVATGLLDSTILVWNLSPTRWDGKLFESLVSPADLDSLWSDLGNADGHSAHTALWTLVASKSSMLEFVKKRLPPAPRIEPQRIKRLIDDLADDRFAVRDAAMRELRKADSQAAPYLLAALEKSSGLELRRRLESLLRAVEGPPEPGEALRRWRALQLLETMNTQGSRAVLEVLSDGAPSARETREAHVALKRLARRPSAP